MTIINSTIATQLGMERRRHLQRGTMTVTNSTIATTRHPALATCGTDSHRLRLRRRHPAIDGTLTVSNSTIDHNSAGSVAAVASSTRWAR